MDEKEEIKSLAPGKMGSEEQIGWLWLTEILNWDELEKKMWQAGWLDRRSEVGRW